MNMQIDVDGRFQREDDRFELAGLVLASMFRNERYYLISARDKAREAVIAVDYLLEELERTKGLK